MDTPQRKVAIITGASSGIGRETAIALSADGWTVVLSARREEELRTTATFCRWESLVMPGDISKEEDVIRLFTSTIESFGRLDMVFNNAGLAAPSTPLDEVTLDTFRSILDVNVIGAFLCTREAFKIFKRQTPLGGRIINNGSISAHTPRLHSLPYTTSKHAMTGLTKSTALDGRAHGIVCTQINVGNTQTAMGGTHALGSIQADGVIRVEPTMDMEHVAKAVVHIANLPLEVTVLEMTMLPSGMPYIGRG